MNNAHASRSPNVCSQANWLSAVSLQTAGSILHSWLTHKHSLTTRLRSVSPRLSIKLLGLTVERPRPFERQALGSIRCNSVCRREVLLCDGNTPLIYAVTVWARMRRNVAGKSLRKLGCRPLGEALFRGFSVYRDPFVFKHLDQRDQMLVRACTSAIAKVEPAWGRSSVVRIKRFPLLVIEVFLSNFIATVRHQATKTTVRQRSTRVKH